MKANEFIKEYGLERAKEVISNSPFIGLSWTYFYATTSQYLCDDFFSSEDPWFSLHSLQKIILSHELVEKMGGLEKAKHMIESARDVPKGKFIGFVDKGQDDIQGYILKQAIADVESCQ